MLLEDPININAGNDYYDQKKPKYKNSLIYLTKALVELTAVGRETQPDRFKKHLRTFPAWTTASIMDRQRMLPALAATADERRGGTERCRPSRAQGSQA